MSHYSLEWSSVYLLGLRRNLAKNEQGFNFKMLWWRRKSWRVVWKTTFYSYAWDICWSFFFYHKSRKSSTTTWNRALWRTRCDKKTKERHKFYLSIIQRTLTRCQFGVHDFIQWKCLNLPGIRPFALKGIIGNQTFRIFWDTSDPYLTRHRQCDINRLFSFEFGHTKKTRMVPSAKIGCSHKG